MVAKDFCRYKPVGIQAYGTKCDYSEVTFELIDNNDSSSEDTNGTEAKVTDVKKESETFSSKISTWLNRSGNNDSKAKPNQSENSTGPPSKNGSPTESMKITF